MDDDDDDALERDAKDTTSCEELRESRRFYDSCHVANDVDQGVAQHAGSSKGFL